MEEVLLQLRGEFGATRVAVGYHVTVADSSGNLGIERRQRLVIKPLMYSIGGRNPSIGVTVILRQCMWRYM